MAAKNLHFLPLVRTAPLAVPNMTPVYTDNQGRSPGVDFPGLQACHVERYTGDMGILGEAD